MKLTVYEPREVEIPDDKIPYLETLVREKWGSKLYPYVSELELLRMAEEKGLAVLPKNWIYID